MSDSSSSSSSSLSFVLNKKIRSDPDFKNMKTRESTPIQSDNFNFTTCMSAIDLSSNFRKSKFSQSVAHTVKEKAKPINNEIKINYLIPVEAIFNNKQNDFLLNDGFKLKNGFLISCFLYKVENNQLINELYSLVKEKLSDSFIYLSKHKNKINMKLNLNRLFSFRPSKKSGLPDFDMPGKNI